VRVAQAFSRYSLAAAGGSTFFLGFSWRIFFFVLRAKTHLSHPPNIKLASTSPPAIFFFVAKFLSSASSSLLFIFR